MVILPLTDKQAAELLDALALAIIHCSDEREPRYVELRTKLLAARAAGYEGEG